MRMLFAVLTVAGAVRHVHGGSVRIVCLGDSITKGVRGGVTASQTYEHHLESWLTTDARTVEVVNKGIGGERTDQALKRLAADVISLKPDIVTVMYGTNDSAIDVGKTDPRLPAAVYEANLHRICAELKAAGATPVLMTPIPLCSSFSYMAREPYKSRGPNHCLHDYVARVRLVAARGNIPLVDNFSAWSERAFMGTDLNALTTDGCHPNPLGHALIAATIYPTLAALLQSDPALPESARHVLNGMGGGPPPHAPAPDGNLALGKTYTQTCPNQHGYSNGLTDGIVNSDSRDGVFATGWTTNYPKQVTIDLEKVQGVGRVAVLNSNDGSTRSVRVSVSPNDTAFDVVGTHEFAQQDGAVKQFIFERRKVRFVRIDFLDTWGNVSHGKRDFMFLREVQVFEE